jgi:hypothetical protein
MENPLRKIVKLLDLSQRLDMNPQEEFALSQPISMRNAPMMFGILLNMLQQFLS